MLLFRCTELLDVDRHGAADSWHAGRIAALVDFAAAPEDARAFFLVRRGGGLAPVMESVHGDPRADPALARLRDALARHPAPHTLSVSLGGGKLLLYLEPLVTGSEKPEDLASLRRLASDLRDARA